MKVLAFGHRKSVGKDTASRFLISILRTTVKNLSIKRVGFADKVKSIAFELYGWAGIKPGHFYDDEAHYPLREVVLPALDKTPRQVWIGVGNGLRTAVYDPTWLDYVFHSTSMKCDLLVISDLRFPAEADGIIGVGGSLYRIDRPSVPKVADGADDQLDNYDRWSGIILNDGPMEVFYEKIHAIAEMIKSTL